MEKKHPADQAADEIWELQCRVEAVRRAPTFLLIALSALLLAALGLTIWLLPHKPFSESENRMLQMPPAFAFDDLIEGKFTEDVADFYADQFPMREEMLSLKALTELSLLKLENNDTLLGREGYLIKRLEYESYDKIYENLGAVNAFARKSGLATTVLVAPRAIDVLTDHLPTLYATDRADAVWSHIEQAYPEALTLTAQMQERVRQGEEVWYHTDHHWTTLGAYYAYASLGETLSYTPYPLSDFTSETVAEDFLGTSYAGSGFRAAKADRIDFYRYEGDESFVTELVTEGTTLAGFYDRSYLTGAGKYSAFLSDNKAHVRVTKPDEVDRPRLLLIKDSYANCLVPFLARHYDLEILDLRYFRGSPAALAAETGIDRVLVLCNADTLATSNMLTNLLYGLK